MSMAINNNSILWILLAARQPIDGSLNGGGGSMRKKTTAEAARQNDCRQQLNLMVY